MKNGPDRELFERYRQRATNSGRMLHLNGPEIREFSECKLPNKLNRSDEEAASILNVLPNAACLVALDETGKDLSSMEFARLIRDTRDNGIENLVFAIGGPDGHGDKLISRANLCMSMGSLTWPHQLARIMLCEQLYRATTILAGHPYHRP